MNTQEPIKLLIIIVEHKRQTQIANGELKTIKLN